MIVMQSPVAQQQLEEDDELMETEAEQDEDFAPPAPAEDTDEEMQNDNDDGLPQLEKISDSVARVNSVLLGFGDDFAMFLQKIQDGRIGGHEVVGRIRKTDGTETSFTLDAMRVIRYGQYFNGDIIECYLQLVANRSHDPSLNLEKVYVANTYFYTKWAGPNGGYEGVKRWFRRVRIFDYKILLFPINSENHWSIVVADLACKNIIYYDSYFFDNRAQEHSYADKYCTPVREFIEREAIKYGLGTGFCANYLTLSQNSPLQQNKIDCGAYVCIFADYFTRRDYSYDFDANDVFTIRMRILHELFCGSMHPKNE